jgi:uracil-DNA glycosylase family 4
MKETVASVLLPDAPVEQLEARCSLCRACPLHVNRYVIGGRGNPKADYFFILSERDYTADTRRGRPALLGKEAYAFLRNGLRTADIDPKDCWFSTATACHPKDTRFTKVTDTHIKTCRPRVHMEVRRVDPLLIIALGTPALTAAYLTSSRPTLEATEGRILPCPIEGELSMYTVPLLVARSPVLMARSHDTQPYGHWELFAQYLARAADMVRTLKEHR